MAGLLEEFQPVIRRSKRRKRTVGLQMANGQLVVAIPHRMALRDVEKVLQKNEQWVRKKLAHKVPAVPKRTGKTGETYAYLGKDYTLEVEAGRKNHVRLLEKTLHVTCAPHSNAKDVLEKWFVAAARQYLTHRTEELAQQHGVRYGKVGVGNPQTRWGSCSQAGNLRYCWRIIMAPPVVIDYLIIHELMHTRVFNHSPAYWAEVAAAMPDYQTHKNWLKAQGSALAF